MLRAKGGLIEIWFPRDDTVRGLKDELNGAQEITVPVWSDMGPVRQIRRLVAHGKRVDAYAQLFVQTNVEMHPLKQVGGCVMKIVKHVVGQVIHPEFVSIAHGRFIRGAKAEMVECNAQRAEADG